MLPSYGNSEVFPLAIHRSMQHHLSCQLNRSMQHQLSLLIGQRFPEESEMPDRNQSDPSQGGVPLNQPWRTIRAAESLGRGFRAGVALTH